MKRKRSLSVEDTTTDQLAQSFNVNVQPLLDAMHSLLFLGVLDENGITIPRPSIVVVGNQSADKSFVVESLAEISLPVGPGIGTRVPLVVRFQSCSSEWITISYKNMIPRSIGRDEIESEVDAATNILAGTGTNVVTDEAILLIIRKPDAPDLIIIDLPGPSTLSWSHPFSKKETVSANLTVLLELLGVYLQMLNLVGPCLELISVEAPSF